MNRFLPIVILSSVLLFACAESKSANNDMGTDGNTSDVLGDTGTDGTIPDGGDMVTDSPDVPDTTDMSDMSDVSDMDMTMTIPCTSTADCGGGDVCVLENDALVCRPPVGNGMVGDACTDGTGCETGICADSRCAAACVDETDCPGAFTCETRDVDGTTLDVCVPRPRACDADGDCTAPQICQVDRSGTDVQSFCGDGVGTGQLGDGCMADGDCSSGLCHANLCTTRCERPNDCPTGQTCGVEPLTLGGGGSAQVAVCVPRPPMGCISDAECTGGQRCVVTKAGTMLTMTCGTAVGAGEYGAACTTDGNCANNLCLNNLCASPCETNGQCSAQTDFTCELTNVPVGGSSDSASLCVPPTLCARDGDCTNPDICYVRREQSDVALLCQDSNSGGGTLGQVCTTDSDCASNLCFDGRFGRYCATPCSTGNDCTLTAWTCVSTPVQALGGSNVNVDLCTPPAPTSCINTDDCSAGEVCGVVPNVANTALESVCIPTAGGSGTGIPCTTNSQCQSNVCTSGFCAALCDGSGSGAECIQNQICVQKTISDSGLMANFDVCLTLPDVPCSATSDCQAAVPEDNVRVCGDIRTAGAFCGFPNAGGGGIGASCATNQECNHNVCLGVNDECSVVCDLDSQCGFGFTCTDYNIMGPGILGLCNRTCDATNDCQNGNVCILNPDTVIDNWDQVCEQPLGPGDIGADSAGGCEAGLVLSIQRWNGACDMMGNCPAGQTCACRGVATCFAGDPEAQCISDVPEDLCTGLCSTNGDCSGVGNNPLTSCEAVMYDRPSGMNTVSIDVCVQPE